MKGNVMADEDQINPTNVASAGDESMSNITGGESDGDQSTLILMADIESLDIGSRSVVLQVALYGLDADEDEILEDYVWSFLPIQPQLDLIQPRTISASTLLWWMQQSDEARAMFEKNVLEDFENLPVMMRHLTREFTRMTSKYSNYELWARGPQFDVVNLESLYADCGMRAPWKYDSVRDLRTLMKQAGLSTGDVDPPHGFIPHQASWDAKFQLRCYREARKALRARA